ncbi:mannitol dehydrogenase family protein [Limosilactobacillus kribbianus]|uniref:mannitol dehydrogenase family protein n=1 Tax=Limosilactobacillus kribbianus TaxID=2982695 RepID=UPI0022646C1B|nr:mannitol dehydrogenase family protein [Limosilactobacillus kribbianus]
MVKLLDDYQAKAEQFHQAGIAVPQFNQNEMIKQTAEKPVWVHFGGGNLFRCFHSIIAQRLLNSGEMKSGIIVAETYDDEVINHVYHPFNNRFLAVEMKSDGTFEKELVASVAESIYAGADHQEGRKRLAEIFTKQSLQLVTFSITEKGYALRDLNGNLTKEAVTDLAKGPANPLTNIGLVASLLLARYQANQAPLALVSTDNFSQNGQRLQDAIMLMAKGWLANGFVDQGFLAYLRDPQKVSFPWSMIDRITPNPSAAVAQQLEADGFEDTALIQTRKQTKIAPFGNTEEVHYLVIEDHFPNGRPALEKAGVILTDRETVNDADQMKVTACLNPLHTSLAIFGCLLGFHSIAAEVADNDLLKLIKNLGYGEDLPVVKDPGIINPQEFIETLITKRLPNKNIPDTPQRIATDTSQKMGIRYGVTLQHCVADPKRDPADLEFIPLVIAGWCRYLMAIDDQGAAFTPSPDPLYGQLHEYLAGVKLGEKIDVHAKLRPILSNRAIFANDLYTIGLGEKIENDFKQMISGPGAVWAALQAIIRKYGKY